LSHAETPLKKEISDECVAFNETRGAQEDCPTQFEALLAQWDNEWFLTNQREWEKKVTWNEKESGQNINGKYFSDDEPKIRFEN
jgi:hypothetical protein